MDLSRGHVNIEAKKNPAVITTMALERALNERILSVESPAHGDDLVSPYSFQNSVFKYDIATRAIGNPIHLGLRPHERHAACYIHECGGILN